MSDVLSESEGKELFPRIKPLCVHVMSSPSLETLTKLREGLFRVLGSRALHPQMVDYVLLPVRMVINKCGRYKWASDLSVKNVPHLDRI